ncbi:MAG: hypothetical protein Q4D66_02235 [Bacteroidales bacterium]|nr:hypothetical protein [Bacteroidales bacterium]
MNAKLHFSTGMSNSLGQENHTTFFYLRIPLPFSPLDFRPHAPCHRSTKTAFSRTRAR